MLTLKGKYSEAIIYNNIVEESALKMLDIIINHNISENTKIRIMPDVHLGVGTVIGYTSTFNNKICPSFIGVDIGCGVIAWNMGKLEINFIELDRYIRENIPFGCNVREKMFEELEIIYEQLNLDTYSIFINKLKEICRHTNQEEEYVIKSLCTLGGGNHFIEIDKDSNDNKWLVIHSGSRNYGLKIANWHQKKAVVIYGQMDGLEYLEDNNAELYLEHMQNAQSYAKLNRYAIGYNIINYLFKLNCFDCEQVESVHNYIDFQDRIIRKGAIRANKDEKIIIPLNMRDGVIIGEGKGNKDWNCSAPHGSGRNLSRSKAKKTLLIEQFEKEMKGIWSSCISKKTIDESPMAYKESSEILNLISPTVNIKFKLIPLYNFKGEE